MYQHILVPTDGTELSYESAEHAIALARSLGARITAIHVMPEYLAPAFAESPNFVQKSYEEFVQATEADADQSMGAVATAAKDAGVECQQVRVRDAQPYRQIIDTASERGCDLIFMASHGRRGLSALLLGSETNKVLTHSRVPVLVHRQGG